jgi:hypothetical protein
MGRRPAPKNPMTKPFHIPILKHFFTPAPYTWQKGKSMKQDTTTAHDEDKTRIAWHPAFLEAIKLELDQYGDALEYVPEYQLTKEPLRIDVVIVKKRKDLCIKKNIGALFRGDNIIEYKSPTGYIPLKIFTRFTHTPACTSL